MSTHLHRRDLIKASVAMAGALGLMSSPAAAALRKLTGGAGIIKIKSIDTFDIHIPQPKTAVPLFGGRTPGRTNVTVVEAEDGTRGYSFLGSTAEQVQAARPILIGQDIFSVEALLKRGLINWGAIEEAMWDAIGKIAQQPVAHLLGGALSGRLPVYLTYVWPGAANQEQVTPKQQGEQAAIVKAAGFKAMKIRIFRSDFRVDVEACSEILMAGGAGFRVMVDRTATQPGLWTYEQGLAAAKACHEAGVFWLEEPFARDDYDGPARLRKEVDMLIVGGEGYHGMAPYITCVEHGTYAILQPEIRQIAGLLATRKVGAIADAAGLGVAPHGTSGLAMAGRVQVSAAMGSLYQEIAVLSPPMLPNDVIAPFLPILHGEQPFTFMDGDLLLPALPGLGLRVDERALAHFRVEGIEALFGPRPSQPH